MVRYETVEVTEEIMKNMAKKRTPRKASGSSSQARRPALPGGSSHSMSPSSSSSPIAPSSELPASQSPRDFSQSEYCPLTTVTDLVNDPDSSKDVAQSAAPFGAVKALTEVARGLGMDVV